MITTKNMWRVWGAVAMAVLVAATAARAETQEIGWVDLLPPEARAGGATVRRGVIQHGQIAPANPFLRSRRQPENKAMHALRRDIDGRRVALKGYIIPVRIEAGELVDFVLVPYVGACIHVPAPPRNQMVLVTGAKGIPATRPTALVFAEFAVDGEIRAVDEVTRFGKAGYRLAAIETRRLSADPALDWRRPD